MFRVFLIFALLFSFPILIGQERPMLRNVGRFWHFPFKAVSVRFKAVSRLVGITYHLVGESVLKGKFAENNLPCAKSYKKIGKSFGY